MLEAFRRLVRKFQVSQELESQGPSSQLRIQANTVSRACPPPRCFQGALSTPLSFWSQLFRGWSLIPQIKASGDPEMLLLSPNPPLLLRRPSPNSCNSLLLCREISRTVVRLLFTFSSCNNGCYFPPNIHPLSFLSNRTQM